MFVIHIRTTHHSHLPKLTWNHDGCVKKVTSQNPESTYEALKTYGTDLTSMAREGKLDPVIGRDDEIRRVTLEEIDLRNLIQDNSRVRLCEVHFCWEQLSNSFYLARYSIGRECMSLRWSRSWHEGPRTIRFPGRGSVGMLCCDTRTGENEAQCKIRKIPKCKWVRLCSNWFQGIRWVWLFSWCCPNLP